MKRITNASLRLTWTTSRYKNERDALLEPAGMLLRITLVGPHQKEPRWSLYKREPNGNLRDYLTGGYFSGLTTELQVKAAAEAKVEEFAKALLASLERTPKAGTSAA